jgi:hypothetical protein
MSVHGTTALPLQMGLGDGRPRGRPDLGSPDLGSPDLGSPDLGSPDLA